MKSSKKLISIVLILIIGFIFVAGIIGIYSVNSNLSSVNTKMNVVTGSSMEPTL